MISTEKPGTPEELVHFGVKGMKWGVRKERSSSSKRSPKTPEEAARIKARNKKIAIGVGALVLAAGTAYVGYRLSQGGNAKLPSHPSTTTKKIVEDLLSQQTDILYSSRGKTKGYRFYKRGGVPNPDRLAEMAFGQGQSPGFFKKFDNGTIAAVLADPLGRRDASNRPIPHDIMIPRVMASGINSIDDVKQKIWPLVKDLYDYE